MTNARLAQIATGTVLGLVLYRAVVFGWIWRGRRLSHFARAETSRG